MTSSSSPTAEWYRRAAERDLPAHSPLHAEWAATVADDEELLAIVDRLPRPQRQPSLLFSVANWLGAPAADGAAFGEWMRGNADALVAAAEGRTTQTNEIGRCAPLVAALELISGPVALLELGASAGLCLLPDRWSYRFERGDDASGEWIDLAGVPGAPTLHCRVTGDRALPSALPRIAARRGIDVHPLDPRAAEDIRWLEALIPPDRPDRLARLRGALTIAGAEHPTPPAIVTGDALDALPAALDALRSEAPEATPVVVSLGTLVYLAPDRRGQLVAEVAALGARLITLEGVAVAPAIEAALAGRIAPEPTPFLLALDGDPLAFCAPHGDGLSWLAPAR